MTKLVGTKGLFREEIAMMACRQISGYLFENAKFFF